MTKEYISGDKYSNSIENEDGLMGRHVTQAVLNFVDLAGSEKLSSHSSSNSDISLLDIDTKSLKSDSRLKDRITEGKNINKSLFYLTQVIQLRASQTQK